MKTTGPFSSLLWLLGADFTPSTPPGMGDVPGLCGRRWVPGRHREGGEPVALSHCCLPLAGHRRGSVNNYPLNKHIGRRRSEDTDVTFCGEITLKTHEKWKGVLSRGTQMKVSLQGHLGVSGQVRTSGLPPGPPRLAERPQPVSPCKRFGAPGPSLAPRPGINDRWAPAGSLPPRAHCSLRTLRVAVPNGEAGKRVLANISGVSHHKKDTVRSSC